MRSHDRRPEPAQVLATRSGAGRSAAPAGPEAPPTATPPAWSASPARCVTRSSTRMRSDGVDVRASVGPRALPASSPACSHLPRVRPRAAVRARHGAAARAGQPPELRERLVRQAEQHAEDAPDADLDLPRALTVARGGYGLDLEARRVLRSAAGCSTTFAAWRRHGRPLGAASFLEIDVERGDAEDFDAEEAAALRVLPAGNRRSDRTILEGPRAPAHERHRFEPRRARRRRASSSPAATGGDRVPRPRLLNADTHDAGGRDTIAVLHDAVRPPRTSAGERGRRCAPTRCWRCAPREVRGGAAEAPPRVARVQRGSGAHSSTCPRSAGLLGLHPTECRGGRRRAPASRSTWRPAARRRGGRARPFRSPMRSCCAAPRAGSTSSMGALLRARRERRQTDRARAARDAPAGAGRAATNLSASPPCCTSTKAGDRATGAPTSGCRRCRRRASSCVRDRLDVRRRGDAQPCTACRIQPAARRPDAAERRDRRAARPQRRARARALEA